MKKIVSIFFAMFLGLAFAISGGVILVGCNKTNDESSVVEEDETQPNATYNLFKFLGAVVVKNDPGESYYVRGDSNNKAAGTVTATYNGVTYSNQNFTSSYQVTTSTLGTQSITLKVTNVSSGYVFKGWYRVNYDYDEDDPLDYNYGRISSSTTYTTSISGGGGYDQNNDIGAVFLSTLPDTPAPPTKNTFFAYPENGTLSNEKTCQITSISLTNYSYGFKVNSAGYLESQNKAKDNSYAMIKIRFNAKTSGSTFTIKYISYGESNYDYAIFSKLDTELAQSNAEDSSTLYVKSAKGESSSSEKTVNYAAISAGWHEIYVKYRKDGSVNSNNDSVQIFFEEDWDGSSKGHFVGMKFGTIPSVTRSGYTLSRWYFYNSSGSSVTVSSSTIFEGKSIYASWSKNSYTVKFAANGGNGTMSDITASYDTWLSVTNSFTRSGYVFSGWSIATGATNTHYYGSSSTNYSTTTSSTFIDSNTGTRYYKNLRTNSGTVTFTAQWTLKSFTLYLDANGGSSTRTFTVSYGSSSYSNISNYLPTRTGYTFNGFTNSSNGGTFVYDANGASTGVYVSAWLNYLYSNNTLTFDGTNGQTIYMYAQWTVNTYNVYFDATGGNCSVSSIRVNYNSTYGDLPEPKTSTSDSCNFAGWYDSSGSRVYSSTPYKIVGNQTLYARWTARICSYYISIYTISVDGKTVKKTAEGNSVEFSRYEKTTDNASSVYSASTYVTSVQTEDYKEYHNAHQAHSATIKAIPKDKNWIFWSYTSREGSYSPPSSANIPIHNLSSIGERIFVYFKQVSNNQLKYDEKDKYFYFEDGYYPQSDASILKNVAVDTATFANVNFQYDSPNNVITLNGAYSNIGSLKEIITTETISNIKASKNINLKVEYLSGSISGGGRIIFGWRLYNSTGSHVQDCGTPPNVANSDTNFGGTITSNVSSGYFKIYIWRNIDNGGSPTFNNFKLRISISYDISENLNTSATATGEKIAISQPFPTDMREWEKYSHGERFSFSYDKATKMNAVTLNSASGWEKIGMPVKVEKNTEYIWSFVYQESVFDYREEGLEICVLAEEPNWAGQQEALAGVWIKSSSGSEYKKVEIKFNSGNNTILYFTFNAGFIKDNLTQTFKMGQFKLSGGGYDANKELPIYSYNGNQYVKVSVREETKWFKFEPIRWRISDYGVENSKSNFDKYSTLLKFKNYGAYNDNFVAVSDLILSVGSMNNTREVREGDSVQDLTGFQKVQNLTDNLTNDSLRLTYNRTGNIINVDQYSGYGSGQTNAVNKNNEISYSSPFRITSLAELSEVGLINRGARASDMVAFILGQDKNQVSYWTRDLSNLGSGIAITSTGTEIRPWLDEVLGIRFAYTFNQGSNVL